MLIRRCLAPVAAAGERCLTPLRASGANTSHGHSSAAMPPGTDRATHSRLGWAVGILNHLFQLQKAVFLLAMFGAAN